VILGARTVDQLIDNLGASGLELTPAEITRLSDTSAPYADDYPYGTAGVAQRDRKIDGGR
jgi:aryl-alcohol dehydrogenase-like predicted oxidoreductase